MHFDIKKHFEKQLQPHSQTDKNGVQIIIEIMGIIVSPLSL
jgi:hypothetical protein